MLLGAFSGADAGPGQPGGAGGAAGTVTWEAARGLGLGIRGPAHLPSSLPAEEPTFRCDACDELFQSKLDLRRHKKYACSSVGAALCEGLAEELKPEGLGGGGGDGQAHECKDCERIFPTEYRCCISPPPPHSGATPDVGPGPGRGPWEERRSARGRRVSPPGRQGWGRFPGPLIGRWGQSRPVS